MADLLTCSGGVSSRNAEKPQGYLVGTFIEKEFSGKKYRGKVKEWWEIPAHESPEGRHQTLYWILYEDGDEEDLDEEEVLALQYHGYDALEHDSSSVSEEELGDSDDAEAAHHSKLKESR